MIYPRLILFKFASGLLLVALFIILSQCSERDRNNPLDPLNPNTQGRPIRPNVVSYQDTVVLSWQRLQLTSVVQYNMYRRLQHESSFSLIGSVDGGASEYVEVGAATDTIRYYRISALTSSFESPLSDSVQIRPGPTYVWAIDFERGQLVKLTHDGAHELFRTGSYIRPLDIAVNPNDHSAILIDPIYAEANRYTGFGQLDGTFSIGRASAKIVIDPFDGSFWVMERDSAAVAHYAKSGELVVRITGFVEPVDIEFDNQTRRVWVLDRAKGEIYDLDDNNIFLRFTGFRRAFDLALNNPDRKVWIADSNAVAIADMDFPQIVRRDGYVYAARVVVNEATGQAWVADWSERFGNSSLIKLSSQGEREFTLAGFVEPKSLAVNKSNGHCFVAEPDVRAFIEVDSTGQIVSDINLQGAYTRILVEHLTR